MKKLRPLALAGLLVCAGCAVHGGPAGVAAVPAQRSASRVPPSRPVVPDRPAIVAGSDTPAVAPPPATAAPAAVAAVGTPPAAAARPAPVPATGDAPPATASVYVFAPQQAVSARPVSAAQSTVSPAAAKPDAARPAPSAKALASAGTDAVPPSRGELQLVVLTSAPEIAAGGIVTVDVMASSDTAVLDAPLHLTFDPNVMAYVDGAPGDFLSQGGSSIVFFADGMTRPGDVAVAAGRVDRAQGATGAGLLCRVRLRGVGAGSTPVIVGQAKAWGVQGEELNVLAGGSEATVR